MKQSPQNNALGLRAYQTYLFASDTSKVGSFLLSAVFKVQPHLAHVGDHFIIHRDT